MKQTNVLVTCAGRRNYLVEMFANALGDNGRVYAADSRADAPALQQAAAGFVLPMIDEPGYADGLLEVCTEHRVSLVVPTNDLELPVLAREKARFEAKGVSIIVSAPGVIEICGDKLRTPRFLAENGIPGPKTWKGVKEAHQALRAGEMRMPVVVKPRWGSASIGVEVVNGPENLELIYALGAQRIERSILRGISTGGTPLIIQEKLAGQEYGMDVVNDLSGRYLGTFVRKKLAMRAGETERALTVRMEVLERLGQALSHALGHVGVLDCDVFVDEGHAWILEMNPRFGGGYPFTHLGGVNLPAAFVAMIRGEPVRREWLTMREGITGAKCDRVVACQRAPMVAGETVSVRNETLSSKVC